MNHTRLPAFILLLSLLTTSGLTQTASDHRWIKRLKSVKVSTIGAGMPRERFDRWFAALVKPENPKYEVDDCGERDGMPEERGKQFPLCVTVTANVPTVRVVELRFVVGTYVVPMTGATAAKEKPSEIKFFNGSIGPRDPRSKQPTRIIRTLSELEKMLK